MDVKVPEICAPTVLRVTCNLFYVLERTAMGADVLLVDTERIFHKISGKISILEENVGLSGIALKQFSQ